MSAGTYPAVVNFANRKGAVELEARKLGMVKAGEKLYVVK